MQTLLEIGLSNAAAATALAVVAVLGSRLCRHRAVAHALWLLVLVKLVTPPLLRVPLSWPASEASAAPPPLVRVDDTARPEGPTERPVPPPLERATLLAEIELLERSSSTEE